MDDMLSTFMQDPLFSVLTALLYNELTTMCLGRRIGYSPIPHKDSRL